MISYLRTKTFEYTLKNRYIKNNMVMMATAVIGGLLGYIFHFVVSRQLSISQYGELQSLLSISIIFGVFNSALSFFAIKHTSVFAANRDYEANKEFAEFLSRKVSKFALVLLVILFVTSPLLANLLHFSSISGFLIISLATFFSTIAVIYFEILRGWQRFVLISVIGITATLVKLVSGTGLAVFAHKASFVSFSFLLSAFVSWYLGKYFYQKRITSGKVRENGENWKEKYFSEISTRKSAVNIFFFSLALILVSNLDVILVKYFSDAQITGYYGAFSLLGKIVLWLNLAVVSVVLPGACADGHAGRRPGKKQILSSYGLMTAVGFSLIMIYYIVPGNIINVFFGEKYMFNTQILWLFGMMSFLLSILTFEANLSFAKHDFRVVYVLVATVFLMVAGLAKYHADLRGIVLVFSLSFLASYMVVTVLNLSHEKRRISALVQ